MIDTFKEITILEINPLPHNEIMDLTKLKVFADNKLNITKMTTFLFDRVENFVGKGENAGDQDFLLFRQCFTEAFFPRVVKSQDCMVKS